MLIKFLDGTSQDICSLYRANLRHANLRHAQLLDANLRGADLSYADLRGAYLHHANLSSADLSYANLSYANLSYANLHGANLNSADLRHANLSGAELPDGFRIARLDFGGWSVTVTPTYTTIGCQTHANERWRVADPRWIAALDPCATAWWTRHGATVQAAIADVMAP